MVIQEYEDLKTSVVGWKHTNKGGSEEKGAEKGKKLALELGYDIDEGREVTEEELLRETLQAWVHNKDQTARSIKHSSQDFLVV